MEGQVRSNRNKLHDAVIVKRKVRGRGGRDD